MATSISAQATFIGGNRSNQSSDYEPSRSILVFGAGNTLALWDPLKPDSPGVERTLKAHSGLITSVRFLDKGRFIIAGSQDKSISVWENNSENDKFDYKNIQMINFHLHSIDVISVSDHFKHSENLFFISGGADGKVVFWSYDSNEKIFKNLHDFIIGPGFYPLSIETIELKNSLNNFVCSIAGTSTLIYIYTFNFNSSKNELLNFTQAAKLKGHEDWIKCLSFKYDTGNNSILLASGSQDRYIRIWRLISSDQQVIPELSPTELVFIQNKQYNFIIKQNNEKEEEKEKSKDDVKCSMSFEALIMGHDDWISNLQWHPDPLKLQLLSSSADTTLMIWSPDQASGIWISTTRLGEIAIKGASTATGASGGFWNSIWCGQESNTILVLGKTGSWRMWQKRDQNWIQSPAITGHTKIVTDISWIKSGRYLLSTSLDQTTRLFSKWKKNNTWHEFSRPQIHGYDMICVSPLSNTRFVSGGDEKILRVFDEPKGVYHILKKMTGIFENGTENEKIKTITSPGKNNDDDTLDESIMPESAILPALGLSNKAYNEEAQIDAVLDNDNDNSNNNEDDEDSKNISYDILSSLNEPPLEDHLQRHTLFPEVEKLYGHGFEINSVDVSHDLRFIATSCRSNTANHAVIRLFDSNTWQELKPNLAKHNLTVTRLRFSANDDYLLSVGRDRQWCIWGRTEDDDNYEFLASNPKGHSRIIWDCAWAPLVNDFDPDSWEVNDPPVFFTASRDKTVKAWSFSYTQTWKTIFQERFFAPITAIDTLNNLVHDNVILCIGSEVGDLMIYKFKYDLGFKRLAIINDKFTPATRVSRISWKPGKQEFEDGTVNLEVAVSSEDTSVRIYSVTIKL